MRIAVVALTRGNASGGSRKHLSRLVPLLREQPEVELVEVFVPPQMAGEENRTWPLHDELRGFRALRRALVSLRPDVVFVPTARMLRVPGVPVVTMVRNMEPLEIPFGGNAVAEGLRNVVRAAAARQACRQSDRVIAVSDHVRNFLVERWKIPDERIGVVYHGVDIVGEEEGVAAPAALAPVEGSRFLFTAGSIRPARGLEDLILALPSVSSDVRLVIAGSVDRGAEPYARRMRLLAEDGGVTSRVVWADQLDREAMSWCFRRAALFVTTSRAEACPNTVLESMAHGAVAVSTDHAPMPELFTDSALYYSERDSLDLSRRIGEALALPQEEQARLRDRAILRARHFTWQATVRATIAELERAIARS